MKLHDLDGLNKLANDLIGLGAGSPGCQSRLHKSLMLARWMLLDDRRSLP